MSGKTTLVYHRTFDKHRSHHIPRDPDRFEKKPGLPADRRVSDFNYFTLSGQGVLDLFPDAWIPADHLFLKDIPVFNDLGFVRMGKKSSLPR